MFGFKNSLAQVVIFFAWILNNYTFGSDVLYYTFMLLLCVTVVLSVCMYDYDYWVNRDIFSPPALPIVGHIGSVVAGRVHGGVVFKRIYDTYKDKKFLGVHQFFRRSLMICDPDLIKRMCVNDFVHFTDRGFFFDKDLDPLAESVLYLRGNEWKRLRAKISPLFSPIKLKGMLPLIENTANEFLLRIKKLSKNTSETDEESNNKYAINNNNVEASAVMDSSNLVGGYTADAIVPCAFGVKSHVMENSNDPFAVALGAFYELTFYNIFEKTMRYLWPAFVLFFKIRIIPKKTHDFFYNIVLNVLKERRMGSQEKRGDFIDMMLTLQNEDRNSAEDKENDFQITDMIIAANAFIIFLGGYETTSSTLSFLFLELAAHPKIQEKLREEIRDVLEKHGGEVNSEMLQELVYMDTVVQEILRLYPPFPTIQRMCTKDYIIPGTSVVVERGTIIIFPVMGLQRDDQYFENASCFCPDRWRDNDPPPPGVYIPFGDGPRYCIGKRFALIQMKTCLVKLLPHVRFSPAAPTDGASVETFADSRKEPFEIDLRMPMTLHPADSRVRISLI